MTSLGVLRSLPHRRAFALAWPAIVGNVSVPLVGLVDTAMLGHFSDAANLGAVALGSTVLGAVFWLLSFLRVGTTSLVGRALGAGREEGALIHAQRAAVLAAGLGVIVVGLQALVVPPLMGFLTPDATVAGLGADYTSIRFASAPAVLLTLVIVGWFVGRGDTRRPLLVVITVGSLNVVLDLVFVGVLRWDAPGAALATVIAEWTGLAVAAGLWWRAASPTLRAGVWRWRGRGLRTGWRALLGLNRDIFLRTVMLYAVLTFMTAYGAHISSTVLAANAILMQLMLLASYGQDGYANAAEAMTSREIGARDLPAFHRAVGAAAVPAVAIGALFSLAYVIAGPVFVGILTSLPAVATAALAALPWVAALPLVSAAAYLFDGVFLGSGKVRWMLVTMAVAALTFFAAWYLGVDGADRNGNLWRAFLFLNLARGLGLAWSYWRVTRVGAWLTSRLDP